MTLCTALLLMMPVADGAASAVQEADLETMPPVVVKVEPETGRSDVDATATKTIRVTFSKPMDPDGYSFTLRSLERMSTLDATKLRYDAKTRTVEIPCSLESGKTYEIWVNAGVFECEGLMPDAPGGITTKFSIESERFQDTDNRAALPYLIAFRTKAAD